MSRSGGVYSLPLDPVETGAVVGSSWANTTLSDVGAALTESLAKDGQTTPTANLPMGGFRHTGVGNATARDQYAAAGQVQDAGLITLGSVAGTDTITGSLTPAISSYATGMLIQFLPAATNTSSVTINVNSLGAKAITKFGTTALVAGDLVSGSPASIIYDGTRFILLNPAFGRVTTVFKTADETVNNSTTLQNDDHIAVSVVASAKYAFQMYLRVYTDGSYSTFSSANMKIDFTVPSGATGFKGRAGLGTDYLAAFGTPSLVGLGTNDNLYVVAGYIETAGSAGTLQLQWAQNAANSVNTILAKGSHMLIRRVA